MRPDERPRVELWLQRRGLAWDPGVTFVVAGGGEGDLDPRAVARLCEPGPGDGHHREHVRTLQSAGEPAWQGEALLLAARSAPTALRLEAVTTGASARAKDVLGAAGLEVEVSLPGAWRTLPPAGTASAPDEHVDLVMWGRPSAGWAPLPAAARDGDAPRAQAGRRGEISIVWHRLATRTALEAFLAALTPGRAYPPGALLSETELAETRRRGDLEASWLLALDGAGQVAGGLIFERDLRPQRAHVRRVHLDVVPSARGQGVATALLRAAVDRAGEIAVERLEADPRSGSHACRALESAGFARAGAQRGAWRMRTVARRWDEDVVYYVARVG